MSLHIGIELHYFAQTSLNYVAFKPTHLKNPSHDDL